MVPVALHQIAKVIGITPYKSPYTVRYTAPEKVVVVFRVPKDTHDKGFGTPRGTPCHVRMSQSKCS